MTAKTNASFLERVILAKHKVDMAKAAYQAATNAAIKQATGGKVDGYGLCTICGTVYEVKPNDIPPCPACHP